MKINLFKNYLGQSLNKLSRIAKSHNNLPALASVLITAKKGELKIKATNLEVGVVLTVPASIEKEGEVAIPLKILSSVVESINDKKITLTKNQNGIKINTKSTNTTINGISSKEFPIIPKLKKENPINLPPNQITRAIEQVIPAVAISNIRPDLASVYLKNNKKDLRIVSTDGFRLGEKIIKSNGLSQSDIESVIVPSQSAVEIMQIFKDTDEDLNVYVKDNQIVFESESIYLISRIIDGNYPDYTQIIPREFKTEVVVDKNKLIDSIRLISLFSGQDSSDIKLNFSKKEEQLTTSAKSSKVGEGSRKTKVNIKGEDVEIIFNYRYLIDGINSVKEDKIKMLLNDSSSPILIKSNREKPDFLYLLSPIKK
ncbi:MAG: DNA polymerase III subunit beta [Candidatus Moranbacteria bacterium]|nr:DNA polymerase III subunit beta [Candidatus Moranbacteria bacterium]